jgi:hypothetical protein
VIETEISRITATKKGQKGQEKPLLSESDENIDTRIKKNPSRTQKKVIRLQKERKE